MAMTGCSFTVNQRWTEVKVANIMTTATKNSHTLGCNDKEKILRMDTALASSLIQWLTSLFFEVLISGHVSAENTQAY